MALKCCLAYKILYKLMEIERDSYALFVDNSGSVGGSENYWTTVDDILKQYGRDITHYYYWNSVCGLNDKKSFENWITTRRGTGGTDPEHVATEIVARMFTNVILVTDGEVGDHSVQRCDQIFEAAFSQDKFRINKSLCYIISTGSGEVNMSVTCPFTRFCESKVFTRRRGEALKAVVQYTPQDFKILDALEEISLENFEIKYELIEGLIIALNMGKDGNIPLKNQLVVMKNRLVKELSKRMGKELDYSVGMRNELKSENFLGAIEIAQQMSNKYFNEDLSTDLEKKINHLINLCGDLRGKYSIGEIKSNKMATAKNAKEAEIDQTVEIQDLSKNPIECPIIMDEDVPQILVDECEPLFLGVEKSIVDDISACPLRILNYPEIRLKFKGLLSTYTGVKYADKLLKNPFTQNRLLGAIPLGTHKSHVKVGNYTLAKMLTGGKILGNLNLYYAVVWYLINEDEINYLKDVKANATEHLVFRLQTSTTMASLCGLPQFVTTQISTDIAIWYCVNSGFLNQPTDRDTFRFHFYNLEPMIKITQLLGCPNHEGLQRHLLRTKALLTMLNRFKKLNNSQKKTFKNIFKGLYQKGIFVDVTKVSPKFKEVEICTEFVPIDGPADEAQIKQVRERLPKYTLEMSNEDLYYISTLLDAQKSASDIYLDYNLVAPPLPQAEVNWCYGLNFEDTSHT